MNIDVLTQLENIVAGIGTGPTGLATAALQLAMTATVGTNRVVTVAGFVPNYAGAEIDIAGLVASTPYRLASISMWLTGGTGGNTTTPSIGEATGFTQGDIQDRYQMSGAITTGAGRTIDNLPVAVPINSDALGQLYIKGGAPAAADSILNWRVDLILDRSA